MFLGPAMRECHREISEWLKPLGIETTIDAMGNFHALYPAREGNLPRLLIGSHLDTVPNAGAFDGILGVVLGISLLEGLDGRRLTFGIEIVGFSEEEGVRFATPFLGSRALTGTLDATLLDRRDASGVAVQQAIRDFGLDPAQMPQAVLRGEVLGYLEFHIEQGPVLEKIGKPLAAVEAIVGQTRLELTFCGRANHAGTTPMDLRYDAIAAAAEWISAVELLARNVPGLVATVGRIEAEPGAANVIARTARLTLDVRHASDDLRKQAVEDLSRLSDEIAQRRGLTVQRRQTMEQAAVALDPLMAGEIEKAIQKAGCEPHRMTSGAGHDAMILAGKVPAAMVFLRTPGGISHDPAESVLLEDVAKAVECGLNLLDQLETSSEFLKRIYRA